MEKKRKRRDQRAVEITREPLRFTHQNLFFVSFFFFPSSSRVTFRLSKERGEPFFLCALLRVARIETDLPSMTNRLFLYTLLDTDLFAAYMRVYKKDYRCKKYKCKKKGDRREQ